MRGSTAAKSSSHVPRRMAVSVVERKDAPGVWSVEAIDHASDGDCYVTVFYGPRSRERAAEYARLKYDVQ